MSSESKNNYFKYLISNVLYRIGVLFCIGTIIQAFLLKIGLTEEQLYLYNSIMYGVQVAVMFAMTFISDKIRNVKAVMALTSSAFVVLFVILIVGAMLKEVGAGFVVLLFAVSIICYIGYGMNSIMSYVFPYKVLDMKDYGKISGIVGGLGGGVTFGVSIIHSLIISRFDYSVASIVFFVIAICCLVFCSVEYSSMQEFAETTDTPTKRDFAKILKNKTLYALLIPNFVRGITTGVVGVITVIAIARGIVDEKSSSYVNVITQLAILLGSFGFAFLCKKIKVRNLMLIGVLGLCVFLPLSIIKNDIALFLTLYGVAYLFMICVDTAIPVLITEIIPEDEIGGYTSIRMMVFTAGTAVSTLLILPIANAIGYVGLLTFAAICLLICGVAYYVTAILCSRKKDCFRDIEA